MGTPAPLQHNVVATTSSGGTPNTAAAAFGSNNAAGSLLIAAIGINLAAASISGIVDTQGNSWAKVTATTGTALDGEVWYAPNSKAGANTLTITITGTAGTRNTTIDLVEASNIILASPVDISNAVSGSVNNPAAVFAAGAATSLAVEFFFGVLIRAATVAPTGGPSNLLSTPALTWNALDEVHSQDPSVVSAFAVSSATETNASAWGAGWTTATANYVGIAVAFKATQTISQAVTASGAGSATMTKRVGKTVSASAAGSPAIVKSVGKLLGATAAAGSSMVRQVGKVVAASAGATSTLPKGVGKLLAAGAAGAASLVSAAAHSATLMATAASTSLIGKSVGKIISAASPTSATMVRSVSKVLLSTVAGVATVSRGVGKTILAMAATTASVTKGIGKSLSALASSIASLVATIFKPVHLPPIVIYAQVYPATLIEATVVNSVEVVAPAENPATIVAQVF